MNRPAIDERTTQLSEARKRSQLRERLIYKGGFAEFPVLHLPISFPLFRSDNGRLAVAKVEYCAENSCAPNFFEREDDTQQLQTALFEMLIVLANDPEASIYQELSRTAIQTERLTLSSDGVVIDGNRRLAAMRALYEDEPAIYAGFAEIEAIVLPEEASEVDLELFEATRQLAPDTKLRYGWLDRRLKLRHHRYTLGIPAQLICETYMLGSENLLDQELEELKLAETYLDSYLGQPKQYHLLKLSEEFFRGLRKQLAGMPTENEKRTWTLIGFAMIKEAEDLGIKPNQYYPFVSPKYGFMTRPILELYGCQNDLWPMSPTMGSGKALNDTMYETLSSNLNRSSSSGGIAKSITRLFNRLVVEHEESPHPLFVSNQLRHISKILSRIDLSICSESQRREILSHLVDVEYQIDSLVNDKKSISGARPKAFVFVFPVSLTGLASSTKQSCKAIIAKFLNVFRRR